MTICKQKNKLLAKRRYWTNKLSKIVENMAQITVSRTYHVCGNPKCKRCREEGGKHGPFLYASYKDENRKTHGFYVPVNQQHLADIAHQSWNEFKEVGKKISEINREILKLHIRREKQK